MGIQSWKHGVHTGNTIRVGGSCAQKRCLSLESGLIKRQLTPPLVITAPFLAPEEEELKRTRRRGGRAKKETRESVQSVQVEELEQFEENVFYSLNKKGRWNLPEKIIREIIYFKSTPKDHSQVRKQRSATDDETRLDHDMTLVERHHLKRGSNCVAVHSTKLPGDGTVSKSKTYLNGNSVLQTKTRQRIRLKKKKSVTAQVEEKAKELPNLEIEISCPYPRDSYLQFSEKFRSSCRISKDTAVQPSRRKLNSEETSNNKKIDVNCNSRNWCSDTEDWLNDEFPGVEDRVESSGLQPHHKHQRDKIKRATAVEEPEEDSHVWFLRDFVQMPCNEFHSDIVEEDEQQEGEEEKREAEKGEEEKVEEEKGEEEKEEEEKGEEEKEEEEEGEEENGSLKEEKALNEAASDSSWEMLGVSEESGHWELLESEILSEGEEFREGDNGILGQLIEDALARRAARLRIAQEDAPISRRKKKKSNRT